MIRLFHPDDADAAVALWRACGLTHTTNDPFKDIARKLTTQPDLFFVYTHDSDLIGTIMAGYEGHRGWINYLAVAADHRRKGVGKELMLHAERHLLRLGCPKINLQVRATNTAVIAFYQSIGFSIDDVVGMGKRLIADN